MITSNDYVLLEMFLAEDIKRILIETYQTHFDGFKELEKLTYKMFCNILTQKLGPSFNIIVEFDEDKFAVKVKIESYLNLLGQRVEYRDLTTRYAFIVRYIRWVIEQGDTHVNQIKDALSAKVTPES